MTTPPPAKFKAYLANIKETVLDSTTQNVNQTFQSLLAAELVQRGVLFDLKDGGTDENADKLLNAVISTAGKPLLDTSSSLPNPLLAASSAMAGMIAESCASLIAALGGGQAAASCFTSNSIQPALTRCKSVNDERLSSILRLLTALDNIESQQSLFLDVAKGYFLRAASMQPDPPQMWKRSLDVMERQSTQNDEEPYEAGVPLQHLIQIAQSKGNEKRVSELSLKLAESCLSSPTKPGTGSLEADVVQAFVTPYHPSTIYTESKCVEKAKQALDNVNVSLLPQEDVLWYKLLQLRIAFKNEQVKVNEKADELLAAAKNRGTPASLESCKETAQSQVWVESLQDTTFNTNAKELCDLVLTDDIMNDDTSARVATAMKSLEQQSNRLVQRARTIGLASTEKKPACTSQDAKTAWNDLIVYTKPILQHLGTSSKWDSDMDLKERQECIRGILDSLPVLSFAFLQSALVATSCWAWMTSDSNDIASFDFPLLELLLDSLSICLSMEEAKERVSQNDSVLKSSKEEGGSRVELTCAHATILSLVGLALVGDDNNANDRSTLLIHTASRKAIGMMEKKPEQYKAQQGKYGSAYVLFLVAWSGLHGPPWPFCNVTQARAILRGARAAMSSAESSWGRSESDFESLLLNLCEADAEGGSLIGGFESKANALYQECLQQAGVGMDEVPDGVLSLVKAHCRNGLARLALHGRNENDTDGPSTAENEAEKAMAESTLVRNLHSTSFYLWKSNEALASSALFHVNTSRQLVADALVRASSLADAQAFLEDAVRDCPSDFDAAFALGAFRLRLALYETSDASLEERKIAQTQLLKAAKINSTKPDPFALLGMWYEVQQDLKRALGCYSKALLLDPSNPVAGRGLLRLKSPTETQKLCQAATNSNSPVNGWAWRAIGQEKAMVESDDELAIICFIQALRCRDIDRPQNESLSIFLSPPSACDKSTATELSNVWVDLAGCYRRVGRYAAAERAFESAWQVDGNKLDSQAICSWAQVELELGLFEEAIEKFELVLKRENDSSLRIAAYGQGSALLALAHRDAVDGKAAASYQHIMRAIACIERSFLVVESVSSQGSCCALKLLGDLFSFGALLPPDVFVDQIETESSIRERSTILLAAQATFVSKGEKAYGDATEVNSGSEEEDANVLRASLLCDLGGNILLQGQIQSFAYGEAQGGSPELSLKEVIENDSEVKAIYDRAVKVFKKTIAASPLHSPAWCGLGCALSGFDPLLAQHAYCTSLTLDKMLPDSWSNLAIMFAGMQATEQSAEMLDGLTQVADSPLMWICRAILLEKEAQGISGPTEAQLSQAADSYRAALQVVKHPTALLGLSLTSRASTATMDANKISLCERLSSDVWRRDSYGYMEEYLGLSSSSNVGACVLESVMETEDNVDDLKTGKPGQSWRYQEIDKSRDVIVDGLKGLNELSALTPASEIESSGIDTDEMNTLVEKLSAIADFDDEPTTESDLTSMSSNKNLNPAHRIIHDPENGTAWLDLAKALAKELLSVSENKKKKVVEEVMQSAIRAGDRAANVFSDELSHPLTVRSAPHIVDKTSEEEAAVSTGVVPVPVDARDVSEAVALSYWLDIVQLEMLQKPQEDLLSSKAISLQRALVMDPENAIARQALKSS